MLDQCQRDLLIEILELPCRPSNREVKALADRLLSEFFIDLRVWPEDDKFRKDFALKLARLPVPSGESLACVGKANNLLLKEAQRIEESLRKQKEEEDAEEAA
jgi:hypothetical protein